MLKQQTSITTWSNKLIIPNLRTNTRLLMNPFNKFHSTTSLYHQLIEYTKRRTTIPPADSQNPRPAAEGKGYARVRMLHRRRLRVPNDARRCQVWRGINGELRQRRGRTRVGSRNEEKIMTEGCGARYPESDHTLLSPRSPSSSSLAQPLLGWLQPPPNNLEK